MAGVAHAGPGRGGFRRAPAQRTDWRRGKVTRRLSGEDTQVNEEWNCDKGRWAFQYAVQSDRLTVPLVREADGTLVPTSWPAALERAATGLREAIDRGGVGVLPGGRLTEEDAYAYAKFARIALATNDVDFRSRPASAEELAFLGSTVAGVTPQHVSYESLEKAPTVLFVGFEPEEESPIVFLRLRKSTRLGKTKVYSVAALASRGLYKLEGTLLQTVPGGEAATLAALDASTVEALSKPGSVIVTGERLATSPGAVVMTGGDSPLLEGRPGGAAYVCQGFVCDAPTTDPIAFKERIGVRSDGFGHDRVTLRP